MNYAFSCETPDDRCRQDEDCLSTAGQYGSYCQTLGTERVCADYGGGVCGRPFLVEGAARLAGHERSNAWLLEGSARPDCTGLSRSLRRELAASWSQLGLMEHASVAAFARFTLQLLGVGAPVTLVEQSQQALADEVLHARLCFSLASAYTEAAIGPGPPRTEHALDLTSLEDIASLTLHEGCVGETIAALEASEALTAANGDPAVRAVLTRIEADERRHAELAWRFVAWAREVGGSNVQRRIERELAELQALPYTNEPADAAGFDGALHGILSAPQRAALRSAALRDVVLPCAQALLPVEHGGSPSATAALAVV